MSLNVKLRRLRQSKGWSQQDVAHMINVSQPAYNKWETSQTKPSIDNLAKLVQLFEIDIYELIENSIDNISEKNKKNNIHLDNEVLSDNLFDKLIDNQEKITELVVEQNKVIDKLLKNK